MNYIGASDYIFWKGINDGYKKLENKISIYPKTQTALNCELAYIDGYSIGSELTTREFNMLTKPKVRLTTKILQKIDDFKANINLEGEY